ncbi:MAG: hypothetical protein E7311_06305 [Clostridiales bacterium]|nr:hypothetical protein [Clostridiales bacterium]
MAENQINQNTNQLVVVKDQNNLFNRALNNLSKSIYLSRGSFRNLFIGVKRNQALKTFKNYQNVSQIPDEQKREIINKKYENAYSKYLEALDNYVVNTIYSKVQENKGSYEDNKLIEEYQKIARLKETEHMEYKYKRQRFLIEKDFATVLKMKNLYTIEMYKNFYVYKMDNIYKTLLRTYSIKLMENSDKKENIYEQMFNELEEYIVTVLPYKMQISELEVYQNIVEEYKKFERYKYEVDLKDGIKYVEKNMLLLSISRELFAHSLPLVAAEQCYIRLLKKAREILVSADNFSKKEEAYKLIINLIECYNVKLLSKKAYWDDPKEREEYRKFTNEFLRINKLQIVDYEEYIRQKESLFIYYDLKMINRSNSNKYEAIKEYYRIKLRELKGLRKIKNTFNLLKGKYKLNKDM